MPPLVVGAADFSSFRVLMRFLNGFVTVGIFPFLLRLYMKNRKRFYLLWGVGFLLYGANIIIRAVIDCVIEYDPGPIHWLVFAFYTFGFVCIITGTGDLAGRARIAFASSLILVLAPFVFYYFSEPELLALSLTLSPYLLIGLYLYYIKRRFGASLDLFIFGWLFLFVVNIATPLETMDPLYVDLFAIIGKTIIFRGMMTPRFSFMADDMKRFLLSGAPELYPEGIFEHCTLVNSNSSNRSQELDWIRRKAIENSRLGIRMILVALYDLITSSDLESNGLKDDDLYLVRMLPRGDQPIQTVGDSVATMSDDLAQLEILISEIIDYSIERGIRCDIVLYSISWAIHTHGWRRVYSLLTSKIPELKTSNVHLYCFYYPQTHERTEVSKFEKIADRVLTI